MTQPSAERQLCLVGVDGNPLSLRGTACTRGTPEKAQDGGGSGDCHLGIESYLTPSSGSGRVAQVDVEEPNAQEAIVAAVKSQQDA